MSEKYYVTKSNKIIFEGSWAQIAKFTNDRCAKMELEQNRDLGFTVYKEKDGVIYHHYHTWLSSGDGCAHSRSFSPPKKIDDFWVNNAR